MDSIAVAKNAVSIQVPIPTFRTILTVIISYEEQELSDFNNILLSYFDEQENDFKVRGRAYDIYIDNGVRCCSILLDGRKLNKPVLVHEIYHIINYILNYNVIYLDESTEEVYAILMEYIFEAILRECQEIDLLIPDTL